MENIFVTKPSLPPIEEYYIEMQDIWNSHWLTNMGPKHNLLENKLKDYLQVEKCSLFSNGHTALELCLQALDLKGEVITTPFTFASTTHAIVRNHLKPVFCDIKLDTYCIDPAKIEPLITSRTSAIVPVHVYGHLCDVEAIDTIAKKYGLKVIYDAAHAFGETYRGVGVGTFGTASMFSFHATKVFNTIEGGAICYRSNELGRELYKLKDFGIKDAETIDGVGSNGKMTEFAAAMGLCNLRHVNDEILKRKQIVQLYRQKLDNIPGLTLPIVQLNVRSNYSYFPIRIDKGFFGLSRDELFEILSANGIYARKYFYPLTSEYLCYRQLFNANLTPIALNVSHEIMTLPLYSDLDSSAVERICEIICDACR